MITTTRSGQEPISDPEYARELGTRLRAIREQRSWSLKDVTIASNGRFTGSAVGTYERGERAISAQRLAELAQLYGVPLGRLLPDSPSRRDDHGGDPATGANDAVHPPAKVVIDLVALETHTEPQLEALRHYIDAIKLRRGDFNGRMLTVRGADVWAWAAMSNLDVEPFIESLDSLEILKHA
jgi:transcriptional regulator with XRE-family HTH domain